MTTATEDKRVSTGNAAYWKSALYIMVAVLTILRLLQLNSLELIPDEAYYWTWSRHLAMGYYDQGPMIAYLIRATTMLCGNTEFGVRLSACLLSAGTTLLAGALGARIFDARAGFIAAMFITVTPLMEVGSIIATYDPPLVFFWTLSLLCLWNALFSTTGDEGMECTRRQRLAWILTGISAGLGLLSKQTIVLLLPSLLLFLIISPKHRFWLKRPEPWTALAIMLLCYTPVVLWNAHHHWWTFRHLLFLEHKAHHTPIHRLGDFIGSQALLVSPILFGGAIVAMTHAPRDEEGNVRLSAVFLICMAAPALLFFCFQALKAKVQGNWVPYGWISPLVLWGGILSARLDNPARRQGAVTLLSMGAGTSILLMLLMLFPFLRETLGVKLPAKSDMTNTAYGWKKLAGEVTQVQQQMEQGGHKVLICGNNYEFPSEMEFYMKGHPAAYDLFLHWKLTEYAVDTPKLKHDLGADAIFLDVWQHNDPDLRKLFTKVTWDKPILIWRKPLYPSPIGVVDLARCYNMSRYVGLKWAQGG